MYLYEIINKIDNKKYVGITTSIKRRWKEHKSELRGDRHHNPHLQAAWNKFGEINFNFNKLNNFNNLEELNKAEKKYIKENNLLNSENGYNMAVGGNSFQHTEESKALISKGNEVSVISKCLKTGKEVIYNKITDVERDGLNPKSIANPCTDRALTYSKRVWMYLKDYKKDPNKLQEKFKNRQNTKARPSRYVKVYGMNIENSSIVEYEAAYHAEKDGFSAAHILSCCSGKRKTHKKYIWKYKE